MFEPGMRFKPVILGAAALAIAGCSLVYAQQRPGDHEGFGRWRGGHHLRLSAADRAAFTDARIAALRAGLQLTPDQAKNWSPFEQAMRDLAQLRVQQAQARRRETAAGPFDRLGRRAEDLAQTSAALKKVSDTGAPLYQSLTDDQKGRFKALARMLRPRPRRAMFFRRWRDDRGGAERRGAPGGGDTGAGNPQ